MHMAYAQTRKDGAVGVDGQTAADYENNLMGNLQDLLDRARMMNRHRISQNDEPTPDFPAQNDEPTPDFPAFPPPQESKDSGRK